MKQAGKGTLKHLLVADQKWDKGYEIMKADNTIEAFVYLHQIVEVPLDILLKLNKYKHLENEIKNYLTL